MKFKSFFGILFIALYALFYVSCSNDEKGEPISLRGNESNFIYFLYPDSTSYIFVIEGGDGSYQIENYTTEILKAEIVSNRNLKLQPLAFGHAYIIITDATGNSLGINIPIGSSYEDMRINAHDVLIEGELTETEKKEIYEKALKTIPVQIGGGYRLQSHYQEDNTVRGNIYIYPEEFLEGGYQYYHEQRKVQKIIGGTVYNLRELAIHTDEGLTELLLGFYNAIYIDNNIVVTMAFIQDITAMFKEEYPHLESVYTFQIIE